MDCTRGCLLLPAEGSPGLLLEQSSLLNTGGQLTGSLFDMAYISNTSLLHLSNWGCKDSQL